jgi:hypothetical protein
MVKGRRNERKEMEKKRRVRKNGEKITIRKTVFDNLLIRSQHCVVHWFRSHSEARAWILVWIAITVGEGVQVEDLRDVFCIVHRFLGDCCLCVCLGYTVICLLAVSLLGLQYLLAGWLSVDDHSVVFVRVLLMEASECSSNLGQHCLVVLPMLLVVCSAFRVFVIYALFLRGRPMSCFQHQRHSPNAKARSQRGLSFSSSLHGRV